VLFLSHGRAAWSDRPMVTVRTRAVADAGKEEGDAKNLEDFVLENPLVMVEFYGTPRCLSNHPRDRRRGIALPPLQ
jgi:hypothetical protein